MRNTMVIILALAAALLVGLSLRDSRTSRKARIALATARQERDAMLERVNALEAENAGLRSQVGAAAEAEAPELAIRPGTVSALRSQARMARPVEPFDSPEMRGLLALQQRSQLDGHFAPLFKALGLDPAKLEQLKQLLVDRQNAVMDVVAAARKQDLLEPGSAGDIGAMIQQEQENVDEGIRTLLGETGYEEYQYFERTQAERSLVDRLASRLSYTDSPLTTAQADAMVNLLTAERATTPASSEMETPGAGVRFTVLGAGGNTFSFAGTTGPADAGATITDNSLVSAQALLTEPQLAALRELQAEQQAQAQMQDQLRRSMPSPGSNATWVGPAGETTVLPGRPVP